MAVKQVIVSDVSGDEVPESEHAKLVIVDHPALRGGPVELDVSVAEATQVQTSKIDLVTIEVYEPDRPRRHVALEASAFAQLFQGVDIDDLLARARRVAASSPAAARSRSASGAARAPKIDYTAPDRFGQLHRGRVTEEEAAMVRGDQARASANREAQGHPPIDWDDPKERRRYGL